MTIFNNAGCVDHVWYYDNNDTSNPQWKLHIADDNTYNYCGETLDSLKKGQGFWVKATGNCTIEIDDLGMPVPPSPDSCDANITNPDNYIAFEGNPINHGPCTRHDRLVYMSGGISFTSESVNVKLVMGDLEVIYYNTIASQYGSQYGRFEYMSINGIVSESNLSASEIETFVSNNISQNDYPYAYLNGDYLTFTDPNQVSTIKFYYSN